jgi:hypothetical protein
MLEGDMDERSSIIEEPSHRQFDNRFFAAICILALAILVNGLSSEIGHTVMRILSDQ